jgi:hypothetical protein
MVSGLPERATVVGMPLADRLVVVIGAPVLGVGLGLLLPRAARWLLTLAWVPLGGPLKLVSLLDHGWGAIAAPAVGGLLGVALAWVAFAESLTVTLTDREVRLVKDQKTRVIPRGQVHTVFLDGKQLVILDPESRQLLRDKHEASGTRLARAFHAHGYRWTDRDPYRDLYKRWVRDTPDLPPAVNAVLAARELALSKNVGTDVRELRDEVQKAGYVIRDEGTRQYWRPVVRA